jgi:hypothetical protein
MKNLIYLCIVLLTASGGTARADHPAVHGMLLFGDNADYASHLPMFHSPHDYQLLLKLNLEDQAGEKTLVSYQAAKKNTTEYFTLVPETMDLTKVINGTKTTFTAKIYQGHFERGGKELGVVKVGVEKIIFSAKLNGQASPSQTKYLVFGESGEYFAAHLIQGKPSFDAILNVDQPYVLNQNSCRRRLCPDGEMVPVLDSSLPISLNVTQLQKDIPSAGEYLGHLGGTQARIQKLLYLEEEELAH